MNATRQVGNNKKVIAMPQKPCYTVQTTESNKASGASRERLAEPPERW